MEEMDFFDYLGAKFGYGSGWLIWSATLAGLGCWSLAAIAISAVRDSPGYRRNWAILVAAAAAVTLFAARLVLFLLFLLRGLGAFIVLFYVPFWIGFLVPAPFVLRSLLRNRPTYRLPAGTTRSGWDHTCSTIKHYVVLGPIVMVWFVCLRRLIPGLECGVLTTALMLWWIPTLRPQLSRSPALRYGLFAATVAALHVWLDFTITSVLDRIPELTREQNAKKTWAFIGWLADQPALGIPLIPIMVGLLRIEREVGTRARAAIIAAVAFGVVAYTSIAPFWR